MTFELNDQQKSLWQDRYALRDKTGAVVEAGIEDTWRRVARAIGDNDNERDAFYDLLHGFHFVPGGRILAGAGAETEKTFYNCYVIPVESRTNTGSDSREAIFDTIKTMVDIMSRGGGVGINWSVLRPSGGYLSRISGTSSGPIGWMDVASTAVGEVIQGGSRRGAAMFMLDDWHPNVLDFIDAKRTKGKITNANISVAISDEFMEAVRSDGIWTLRFPDTSDPEYNSRWDGDLSGWEDRGGKVNDYKRIPARELWAAIGEAAHASGEPGVVFLGRYNALSTAGDIERIISVNPCGEQGLGAYSVCNLGAMNLDAYFIPQGTTLHWDVGPTRRPLFDYPAFTVDVKKAIRFLDNVIDKTFYFLPQTEIQQMKLRRIGLGVMGLADILIRLGIRYGSPESVEFVDRVFQTMKDAAIEESCTLARKKGPAKGWLDAMWERPYLAEYFGRKGAGIDRYAGLRNLFLLTQAPTGTTSLLAGVNSGIEPYFSLKTWREDRTGGRYVYAKAVEGLDPDNLPDYVVTSNDVSVEEHIAVQAATQRNVDSSVSKTINAPKSQTVAEAQKAFTLAYDSGLKGVAYYRDGSRSEQVLYSISPNERIAALEQEVSDLKGKLKFKERVATKEFYPSSVPEGSHYAPDRIKEYSVTFSPEGHPLDCRGTVVYEEGCQKCHTCAWSAC